MITDKHKILVEWAYRTHNGKPNPKSMAHQIILEGVLKDFGWGMEERGELLRNLQDASKKKPDPEREKLMQNISIRSQHCGKIDFCFIIFILRF